MISIAALLLIAQSPAAQAETVGGVSENANARPHSALPHPAGGARVRSTGGAAVRVLRAVRIDLRNDFPQGFQGSDGLAKDAVQIGSDATGTLRIEFT